MQNILDSTVTVTIDNATLLRIFILVFSLIVIFFFIKHIFS